MGMKKWWSIVLRVLVWGGLAAVVGQIVISTKQSLSYSSVCTRCLATRSGVERSFLGIPYEDKHQGILFRYATAEKPHLAKFSEGRQTIYEQIHGKTCEHDFVRMGRCRYRAGSIGCNLFGSEEVSSRNEVVLGAFKAFERIGDKELAAASCQLIEREFPLKIPPRTGGQNLIKDSEEERERYRRMILLGELLGLVRNREDWATVLDFGKGGFQGDPPLLKDLVGLTERLRSDDPTVRRAAASALAGEPSTSAELMEEMLRHDDKKVVEIAGRSVFFGKRFPLFGSLLRALSLDDYQRKNMGGYGREEFEALFSMNDPLVDAVCADAIAKGDRFEILEMALAAMNRHPSEAGFQTIKRLLRGSDPFFENQDRDSDEMWNGIKTIHAPIAELRESMMTDVGPNRRLRSKYNFMSAIKSVGATGDASQWSFLRDAYLKAIAGNTAEWWLACMGKAMHELDAPATEIFLIAEIKGADYERLSAAFSSMGLIASRNFEKPLDEFVAHPPKLSSNGVNPPRYYFFEVGYGARFLKYALHRCHGIPTWKLVKNAEARYVIEKPQEISR